MIEERIYLGVRIQVLIPWSSKGEVSLWNGLDSLYIETGTGIDSRKGLRGNGWKELSSVKEERQRDRSD